MASHVRLWLDDQVPAPEGWTTVTNVDAARSLLESGVDTISLGDRLDASHGHRLALLVWMMRTGTWPRERPEVHGSRRLEITAMKLALDAAWPLRERVARAARAAERAIETTGVSRIAENAVQTTRSLIARRTARAT
ncbi:cyclic-phosphate processing receiver domain-containing protein [Sandaracinus amylolyticus]|uniref:cyclic-phosphate processing receiver domain-containing protein n=1 Tax=Sandaracinus amylolyticus TaxID=927083 RepID=UPI001F410681|nr:cyclic-phosphate processing receiver domain-containing protein [Sandaracinus amylolyticus]UJR84503.1 Hypothetical protein I5071_65820 [Sandaracinus amylolyticus]